MSDKMWDPLSSMKGGSPTSHESENEIDEVTQQYGAQTLAPQTVRKPIHSAELHEPPKHLPILNSKAYTAFRSSHAKRSLLVNGRTWSLYEVAAQIQPVSLAPLIFLPSTSTSPESFFQQLSFFSSRGFSCMAVNLPVVWTKDEFIGTFRQFLDTCRINSCHLVGAGLGGFLALCFAANCPDRVESLAVSNAFMDTRPFTKAWPVVKGMKMLPDSAVKKLVIQKFPEYSRYPYALEFVKHHFSLMSQPDVASRMTIQSTQATVTNLSQIDQERLVFIDTQDESSMPQSMREQLTSTLNKARQAGLREGGEYPWLSVPEDFNAMLLVHMRKMVELGPKPIVPKGAKSPSNQSQTSVASPSPVSPPIIQPSPRSASPQPNSPSPVTSPASQTTGAVSPISPAQPVQSHPFEAPAAAKPAGFGFLKPAHSILSSAQTPATVLPTSPSDVSAAASAADAYQAVAKPTSRIPTANLEKISTERAAIIASATEDAERKAAEAARLAAEAEQRRIEERQRLEEEAAKSREAERIKLEKEREKQKRTDDMLASLMG